MSTDKPMGILAKAADVTELLAARGPLGPADIADDVNMPRSSVYRLADALGQAQLTETTGGLPDPSHPPVAPARRCRPSECDGVAPGQNGAGRAGGDHRPDRVPQPSPRRRSRLPRLGPRPGHQRPHPEARPILALCTPGPPAASPWRSGTRGRTATWRRRPFPKLTPGTLTTAAQLRRDVAETRDRGFSISDEDVTIGIGALGAPLFSGAGRFCGALSIAGLAEDSRSVRDDLAAALLASARELIPLD